MPGTGALPLARAMARLARPHRAAPLPRPCGLSQGVARALRCFDTVL